MFIDLYAQALRHLGQLCSDALEGGRLVSGLVPRGQAWMDIDPQSVARQKAEQQAGGGDLLCFSWVPEQGRLHRHALMVRDVSHGRRRDCWPLLGSVRRFLSRFDHFLFHLVPNETLFDLDPAGGMKIDDDTS